MDLQSLPIDDLLDCCRYGELEDIDQYAQQMLTDCGLDPNGPIEFLRLQGRNGNTCLHMAAANGHQDLLLYILSRLPAPVTHHINIRNDQGSTALHWAALNGHVESVKMLLKSGADAKIKNDSGHTALFDAQSAGKDQVVAAILDMVDFGADEDDEEGGADGQQDGDNDALSSDGEDDTEIVFQQRGSEIAVDIRPKQSSETQPATANEELPEEAGAR